METITFMTSLLTFYLKGEIKAEQNFLKLKKPNTILTFIPLGAKKYNLPINQIASVGTNFQLLVKSLLVGIAEIIIAFVLFGVFVPLALVLLFIGAFTVINSFQTALVISTTSGDDYVLYFLIFEKGKAETAETAINNMISARIDDTNVRVQTQAQTAQLNSAQAANTQALIDAINSTKNQ